MDTRKVKDKRRSANLTANGRLLCWQLDGKYAKRGQMARIFF
nr:MAG TPA: hypothetical protein [Caudoviricetes sp.]